MSSQKVRPIGVVILAVLEIISGIVAIVVGIFFGSMSGMMGLDMFGGFDVLIGGALVALGLVSFVMAWGLLQGKSWAWTITLILTIISIIISVVSFSLIGIIIDGVILYYLFRPHVKAYFGKSEAVL